MTSLARLVLEVVATRVTHLAVVALEVLVTSLKHSLVGVHRSAAVDNDNNRAHLVVKM
jgi:hypothetical protein